jgi:DNA-binding NarL/FixJ family response regulator
MTIRVLLADDSLLIRVGLETLLARRPDITVVGQAANGREAIALAHQLDPDVVLMDIRMPEIDGIAATAQLVGAGCRAGIIMMTTFSDDADVFRGITAGARGYLLKDVAPDMLVDAIRAVAGGNALIQPEVTGQVLREFRRLSQGNPDPRPPEPRPPSATDLLTERENDILRLIARGQNNKEIGETLSVSIGTVKNHVSSILTKLGARDRIQAVLLARTFGLLL